MLHLQPIPMPVPSRKWLQQQLTGEGFSLPMMHWLASSLGPMPSDGGPVPAGLTWNFDLAGAKALYESYW